MLVLVPVSVLLLMNIYSSNGEIYDVTSSIVQVTSSCRNNLTTKWNSRHVGIELKKWLNSVKVIYPHEMNNTIMENLKSYDLLHISDTRITTINNVNSSTNKLIFPIWKKAAFISQDPFHDGFFYANNDGTGSMTGNDIFNFNLLTRSYLRPK